MKKTLSIFGIIILFLYLVHNEVYAQSTGDAVVLLSGKVLDINGNPLSVKIEFIGDNGKKITTTSNSKDGLYQQVLTPGIKYLVSFKDYLEVSGDGVVYIPNVKKYTEMSRTFTLRKIEEGQELSYFKAFNPNDSILTGNYANEFQRIKDFMSSNLNATIVIVISGKDSWFATKSIKEKYKDSKNRTKTRTVKIQPIEQMTQLLEARKDAVMNYLRTLKIRDKSITIEFDNSMGSKPVKTKKKKKASTETIEHPNVIVKVGKIKKM